MRRRLFLPLLALPLSALPPLRPPSASAAPAELPPEVRVLVAGQSAFGLALYGRLAEGTGNLLLSPYSVHTALAMTRAGARGETAAQMDRVLRLPESGTPQAWKTLVSALGTPPAVRPGGDPADTTNTAYSLSVANALWGQRGFPFVPEFRSLLESAYGAGLREVDFAQGPAVRKEINDWVLSKTNDKIKDLIPEGLPTPDTRLALVNAIHFLAQWDQPFPEARTTDLAFTNVKGERVNVKGMRRTDHGAYYEDAGVQVLTLRYRQGAAEMLVALPKPGAGPADGLAALERGLSVEGLERWSAGARNAKVALTLPRFKFESTNELSRTLAALGMPAAFDPTAADFRGMADVPGQPLYVGPVLHKAFIAVDEKGTEAAAATAVMMGARSVPQPEEPVPFVCDRPFLFVLRHRLTGALLFVGRLALPEPAPTAAAR